MTKRFTLNIDSEWWVVGDNTIEVNEFGYREDLDIEDMGRGLRKELTEQETVNLLNQLYEENRELRRHLDFMISGALTDDKRIKELYDENEQLQQRNDRQAKRLGELYELMAKKDWESLTEIIDDFCSCEEQLQRESGTYGGLE